MPVLASEMRGGLRLGRYSEMLEGVEVALHFSSSSSSPSASMSRPGSSSSPSASGSSSSLMLFSMVSSLSSSLSSSSSVVERASTTSGGIDLNMVGSVKAASAEPTTPTSWSRLMHIGSWYTWFSFGNEGGRCICTGKPIGIEEPVSEW